MISEPIKFLLVDDKEENLIALEALVRRNGLQVLMARSGAEALELLLIHDVALALVDVQMGDMDGFELAELMRGAERTKSVPIIFVTAGSHDPQRVFKGYETGAVDFLFKPIEPHILKSKVDVFFELYRQRQELATSLRLNEMFVGILGHDLRNPLGTIITGAHLLSEQLIDDNQHRTLRRMTAAGRRMTDMIEQLLDLTRARLAGGLGFVRVRKTLNVSELVQSTVDELHGAYPDRVIHVESSGPAPTVGDADRLLQLFSNLIANAVHHGTPNKPITVKVLAGEQDIVATVHNHGTISAAILPTIFDPFRGRPGRSGNSQGLGLGLFISRQIATAHEGEISVASENGETTFTVRLPRAAGTHKQPAAGSATRSTDAPAFPPVRKTVLIVDDDKDIRDSLCEAFEEEGYTATTASNGREALDRLNEEAKRPDVVILDLVLPVMDGCRVYQAMQADKNLSKIPVIVSTSNPSRAPTGVTVIPKPLKLNRLLDTVANLWRQ